MINEYALNWPKEVVLYGGTGQAKVIKPIIEYYGSRVIAVIDDTPGLPSPFNGVPIYQGWFLFTPSRAASLSMVFLYPYFSTDSLRARCLVSSVASRWYPSLVRELLCLIPALGRELLDRLEYRSFFLGRSMKCLPSFRVFQDMIHHWGGFRYKLGCHRFC